MLDYEKLIEQGKAAGFTHVAPLRADTIELKNEVRDMCAVNSCGKYGSNWACPPGCGTLEECRARLQGYEEGILVQCVGQMEDSMDVEVMLGTAEQQHESLCALYAQLVEEYREVLAIGAGSCERCAKCTYPDAPCRFPDKMISSMEAYGMLVTEVCQRNDLPYYYGPNTIAYTSCFLLKK